MPAVSDGSGSDRALLKRANDLLLAAGCKRDGGVLKLPSGAPLTLEFLEVSDIFQPHVTPFQQNLKKLGVEAHSRIVDPTQLKSRTDNFDFDIMMRASGGSMTPGPDLRQAFSSPRPRSLRPPISPASPTPPSTRWSRTPPTPRRAGTQHRLPRARPGLARRRYWVPAWYNDQFWVASWNAFSRPERQPATRRRRSRHLVVGRGQGKKMGSEPAHVRLYLSAPVAHDPDAVRHHAGFVRDRAVRAGRPG